MSTEPGESVSQEAVRCPKCGGSELSSQTDQRDSDELKRYVRKRAFAAAVVFFLGAPGVILIAWGFAPGSVFLMSIGVAAYFVLACVWVRQSRKARIGEHPEEVETCLVHECAACGATWRTPV